MNKKGFAVIFTVVIVLVMISLIALIIFGADRAENLTKEQCISLCSDYNAEYISSEASSGYNNPECWCRKDGQPLRVS